MQLSARGKLHRLLARLPSSNGAAVEAARMRNSALIKPWGALGRLEDLAVWYAGWRGDPRPHIRTPQVLVFAGSHGINVHRVSAYPAEITGLMVENFRSGHAAINQLARLAGAKLSVVPLEIDRPTADFTLGPAMTGEECCEAMRQGAAAVDPKSDLLVVGEMGIGNSTSAAALAMALFGGTPRDWAGRGTGIDDAGLKRKFDVISRGLNANPGVSDSPMLALQSLGGREIAAMVGAILQARLLSIPVVLDGFICCAAAAVLHCEQEISRRRKPHRRPALEHVVAGHLSAEHGHARLLRHLEMGPLLALGLRLGEASGATLTLQILKAAVACHSGMATFEEAGLPEAMEGKI